jgi:pimeloyl-ACP methyl ester carboxylesterase
MASVARDAAAVLDELDIASAAVVGQSGGGPFAVALAAELGDRITALGVASGGGSFVNVPGAVDALDDVDRRGLSLIGVDDQAAADAFAEGFAAMADLPAAGDDDIRAAMRELLPTDAAAMDLPGVADGLVAIMREALRQGVEGCAWDNVAWLGPWRTDLSAVTQPTWLWYGTEDPLAPVAHGVWLSEQLPHAHLVVREGEGHLGIYPHWDEIVRALTGGEG